MNQRDAEVKDVGGSCAHMTIRLLIIRFVGLGEHRGEGMLLKCSNTDSFFYQLELQKSIHNIYKACETLL